MKLFSKRVYKPIIIMFITTKTEGEVLVAYRFATTYLH